MQKIWVLGSILLTIGCSQRAPWVVPTAPVAAPRSVSKRPGPSAQAQPALSAVEHLLARLKTYGGSITRKADTLAEIVMVCVALLRAWPA